MKRHQKTARTVLLAAAAVAVVSLGALAADVGSESDPLVTLSYLTQKFTPSVLQQVDGQITTAKAELASQLDAKLSSGGSGASDSSGFETVTLTKGQKLIGGVGCELMLRSGTATCTAANDPGLIDLTGGGEVKAGAAVTANHLYMTTEGSGGVSAATGVTLLVRGSYTIQ
jgi:opacity protein-like surface antigen